MVVEQRDARDARILDMYEDGQTLESIGASVDLTRERVRQIIAKSGGVTSEDARAKRAERKAVEFEEAVSRFNGAIHDSVVELDEEGFTREEIERRLTAVYPREDEAVVSEALKRTGLVFNRAASEPKMPEEVIEAAVWFLIARDQKLPSDEARPLTSVDQVVIDWLTTYFDELGTNRDFVSQVIHEIAAARAYAQIHAEVSITGQRYEDLRSEVLVESGAVSGRGLVPWPPTKQTVMKRLGDTSWSDALQRMGLGTSDRGRSKGQLQFASDDYAKAIRDYIADARNEGVSPTLAGYVTWEKGQSALGIDRPSGASIRNVYKNWTNALRTAGNPEDVGVLTERASRTTALAEGGNVATYERIVEQQSALAENYDVRIAEVAESMAAAEHPDAESMEKYRTLTESRQVLSQLIETTEQQKRDAAESGRQAQQQHKTNVLLAAASVMIAAAAAIVPILQYWEIWPLGGR